LDGTGNRDTLLRLLRAHYWGIALIVGLLIASTVAVRVWKRNHPGAMSVIEAQAMDMTAMRPPPGAVPVATEVVHRGGFSAKVTYTGSVAPLTEQIIYPRVEGWLRGLSAYDGDGVPAGKLLAVVDSPDLQTKVAEAAAGRAAAESEIAVAESGTARMTAERAAAQGEIGTAKAEAAGARARLVAATRAVTQAEKELKSARASLEYWRAEIKREANLLKAGAVSLQEYQSEKSQAATAEAELENKQAALEEARANVQAAEADVESKQAMIGIARQRASAADAAVAASRREIAEKAAAARQAGAMVATAATIDAYRYIRAPFAGIVTKRYISPGQLVNPSTAILDLVQIDRVRLQANVADRDLPRIQVGARVEARLPKDPTRAYNAVVTSVSPLADQSSRTAIVEAIVENPDHRLVPGDFVTMDIATSATSDRITVPSSALVRRDERDAVWVVKTRAPNGKTTYYCTMHPDQISDRPGKCHKCGMDLVPKVTGGRSAQLVYVTVGDSDGERTEITSGLSEGDEVIYRGHTYLKEGDLVFPTAWGEDGPKQLPDGRGMPEMPGMGQGKDGGQAPGVEMNDTNMPGMDHSNGGAVEPVKGERTYTCPMHPEIISKKPGDCPKCGMRLVEGK